MIVLLLSFLAHRVCMCVLVCSDEMGTVASVLLETANMSRVVKLLITHVQVAITRVCIVYMGVLTYAMCLGLQRD